jgi:hypothetical protein
MTSEQRFPLTTHLVRAGVYIACVFWLFFVIGSLMAVSRPDTGTRAHVAGWTILVMGSVVMFATMDRWVRYLQVVLGSAVFGGLFMIVDGHSLSQPEKAISRLVATTVTLLIVGSSVVAGTFAKRKLMPSDRLALIGFLAAFVVGLSATEASVGTIAFSIALICLVSAWVCNRPSRVGRAARPLKR